MNTHHDDHVPDVRDRHRRLLALAVLAMSVRYAALAGEHFASPISPYLDYLTIGAGLFSVALVLPIMWWKLRKLPQGLRHLYFSQDGFVADAISRAHIASWTAALLVLGLFEIWIGDKDVVTELPAEFFLQVTLALMLATFSIAFLVCSRADSDEGDWAESGA